MKLSVVLEELGIWGADFDIEPDIVTCAKGLSSAYAPISAVLVSENIAYEVESRQ